MNFLAHAYLSFEHPEILVGNMISDFVKGRKKLDYPEGVQKGIQLHREIDTFTDAHPATREAANFYREKYRLYALAFIDIVYDHFLANDTRVFPENKLADFAESTYASLEKNTVVFPEKFRMIFPYMRSQNWLYRYRYMEGMERSFGGLVNRAVYLNNAASASHLLQEHYEALSACYHSFFPELESYSRQRFELLFKQD